MLELSGGRLEIARLLLPNSQNIVSLKEQSYKDLSLMEKMIILLL